MISRHDHRGSFRRHPEIGEEGLAADVDKQANAAVASAALISVSVRLSVERTAYRNRVPEERASDLKADELLYTDDPEADQQAGPSVGD